MARTTTKRKSESDLPVGKSKVRKTSISSRKDESDSAHVEGESTDELFVGDQPTAAKYVKKDAVKSRNSEPARLTREDEYDEDPGRMESQQFLALVEFESKKKRRAAKAATDYSEKFTRAVKSDEEALKKHLQDLIIESTKRDNDFLETFREAYTSSAPFELHAKDTSQHKDSSSVHGFASLYKRSRSLTARAFEVVEKFEIASAKTSSIETSGLMDNEWGGEDETVAKVLAIGKAVGLDKYQSILTAGKPMEMDGYANQVSELLYGGTEEGLSPGWGKVAKKQEKAARKLVKTFSMEVVV